jgi:hypothetical protein
MKYCGTGTGQKEGGCPLVTLRLSNIQISYVGTVWYRTNQVPTNARHLLHLLCRAYLALLSHDHNKFCEQKRTVQWASTFGKKLPICRVADPHCNANPDPAFHLNGDPESAFNANLDLAPNRSDGNL